MSTLFREAEWIVTAQCGLGCSYCCQQEGQKNSVFTDQYSIESALRFFVSSGQNWRIHLSGGEPCELESFQDLCLSMANLSAIQQISLVSNGTHDSLMVLLQKGLRKKISQVILSWHEERFELLGCKKAVISRYKALIDGGLPVFTTQVMTPFALERFAETRKYLCDQGIVLVPRILHGKWLGRWWPRSYSQSDRISFINYSLKAEEALRNKNMALDNLTIDLFLDRKLLDSSIDFRGQNCAAGSRFFRLLPTGEIRACGDGSPLGSVLGKIQHVRKEQRLCRWRECPSFCLRHAIPPQGR